MTFSKVTLSSKACLGVEASESFGHQVSTSYKTAAHKGGGELNDKGEGNMETGRKKKMVAATELSFLYYSLYFNSVRLLFSVKMSILESHMFRLFCKS
jgi:hypothetical protein